MDSIKIKKNHSIVNTMKMSAGMNEYLGRGKTHLGPRNYVLDTVYMRATLQIRFSDPCSEVVWAVIAINVETYFSSEIVCCAVYLFSVFHA